MEISNVPAKEAMEFIQKEPIAMIAIGSVEYHGAQAPLGTDYIIPDYIVKELSKRDDILALPPIPYGNCQSIKDFPGTINIGTENLIRVLNSITESLLKHGVKKFIFVNGHGGNIAALDQVGLDTFEKGGIVATIDWWNLAKLLNKDYDGGHGDIQETSVAMAVDEQSVNLSYCEPLIINDLSEEIKNKYISLLTYKNGTIKIVRDFKSVVPHGWIGPYDPKNSTKELGERILKDVIQYIGDFVEEFKKVER